MKIFEAPDFEVVEIVDVVTDTLTSGDVPPEL